MKAVRMWLVMVGVLVGVAFVAGLGRAEEKTFVKGKIVSYDLKARTLIVKADSGEEMTFFVENDVALNKLDDRLFADDEVKIKYLKEGDKLVIKAAEDLKGTKPGC